MGTAAGSTPTRVTHVFDHLARDFRLPRQEKAEWTGADGVTVEGLLFYPLDYEDGRRFPLVIQTHGGPQASDKFGFGASRNYTQVLTAMGYVVLQPNYRGSTGYGDTFLRDMVGGYFKHAHLDVIAGADHLIAAGLADGDRMAKMGWSGGGHMTNKVITYTDRFKAAASGAGAANWISMYAQSDTRSQRTPWFGGTPWQVDAPTDLYWEHSPLKYVSNVTTPDDLPGRRGRPAGADAAIGRDAPGAQEPRGADAFVCRTTRGARLARAPASAVQDERRARLVRNSRDSAVVYVGRGASIEGQIGARTVRATIAALHRGPLAATAEASRHSGRFQNDVEVDPHLVAD